MSATAVSRVGNLIRSQPYGYEQSVSMEDMSTAGLIPAFTLIGLLATGYGELALANVAYTTVGFITGEHDTSDDAANGDTVANVRMDCVVKLIIVAADIGDVGDPVFIVDNQTVTVTDPSDATPQIGHITEFIDSTHVWVKLHSPVDISTP